MGHVISSLSLFTRPVYLRPPPFTLIEHAQCRLSQLCMFHLWFHTQGLFFLSLDQEKYTSFNKTSTHRALGILLLHRLAQCLTAPQVYGSLRPAAPICCSHSAGRGLTFCVLALQLHFVLNLSSATPHRFSQAQFLFFFGGAGVMHVHASARTY